MGSEKIRILEAPYRVTIPPVNGGKPHIRFVARTNKGIKTIPELAVYAQMSVGGFRVRMRAFGWDHPHLFDPPGVGFWAMTYQKQLQAAANQEKPMVEDGELGKLADIPDIPRTHLLAKIPPPGAWEQTRRTRYDNIRFEQL
jgi:hypothetical protein